MKYLMTHLDYLPEACLGLEIARACWIHVCISLFGGQRSRRCSVATWNRKICWYNLCRGVWASWAEERIPVWSSNPQYWQPTAGMRAKSARATHLFRCWIWTCNRVAKACLWAGLLHCCSSCSVVLMPQSSSRVWSWGLNPGSWLICQLRGSKLPWLEWFTVDMSLNCPNKKSLRKTAPASNDFNPTVFLKLRAMYRVEDTDAALTFSWLNQCVQSV